MLGFVQSRWMEDPIYSFPSQVSLKCAGMFFQGFKKTVLVPKIAKVPNMILCLF